MTRFLAIILAIIIGVVAVAVAVGIPVVLFAFALDLSWPHALAFTVGIYFTAAAGKAVGHGKP